MNDLERYVAWVLDRLGGSEDVLEEPDLETKSRYPDGEESTQLWAMADLIAALSNDLALGGYRCVAYGPGQPLHRPSWLPDEAVLGDKLRKHFDGGVMPRVELIRRETQDGVIDVLVIVDRSETPYVTRDRLGGTWVVRVRSHTSRRNATRAELLALTGGGQITRAPVRMLTARLEPWGQGTYRLIITNTGTVDICDIEIAIPDDSTVSTLSPWSGTIDLLKPGERDAVPMHLGRALGKRPQSSRIGVRGTAVDGEPVTTEALVSDVMS